MTEPVPYWNKHNGNMDDSLSALLADEEATETREKEEQMAHEVPENLPAMAESVTAMKAISFFAQAYPDPEIILLGMIAKWLEDNPDNTLATIVFSANGAVIEAEVVMEEG